MAQKLSLPQVQDSLSLLRQLSARQQPAPVPELPRKAAKPDPLDRLATPSLATPSLATPSLPAPPALAAAPAPARPSAGAGPGPGAGASRAQAPSPSPSPSSTSAPASASAPAAGLMAQEPLIPQDVRARFAQVNWERVPAQELAPVIQLPVTARARFAQVNWERKASPQAAPAPVVARSLKPSRVEETSSMQSVTAFFSDIQW